VAVKIKLQRLGQIRDPHYRVVVSDSRTRRSGRAIETIGKYHPKKEPSFIEIDSERAQYWLGVGAQPTEPVAHLLKITGDWQKFKGLPGAEGTLKVAEPKPSKQALFEAALAAAGEEPTTEATTPKQRKSTPKKAETDKADATEKTAEKAEAAAPAASAESSSDGEK
jgi:small subunit ribosomal protein S16